jgi:hypothetical protein
VQLWCIQKFTDDYYGPGRIVAEGPSAMHYALNGLGFIAAIVFIIASGAMNWVFMSGQGHSPLEAQILGAVSLGVTAMSALLPFRIASAWQARQVLKTVLSGLAFLLFLSFSLLSAVGFAASTRGAVAGGRDTLNGRLQLADKELSEVGGRLAVLTIGRPASALEQELAALRQRPRWQSSLNCSDATAGDSRKFCEEYFKLKGELENALESSRLADRQARLRQEVKALKEQGAGQDADPQASTITKLLQRALPATDYGDVRLGLILFVAVLVEFGAAFGLYLTGHDFASKPERSNIRPLRVATRDESETAETAMLELVVDSAAIEPASIVSQVVESLPLPESADTAVSVLVLEQLGPKNEDASSVAVLSKSTKIVTKQSEPKRTASPASSQPVPRPTTKSAAVGPKVAERWRPEHAGRLLASKI